MPTLNINWSSGSMEVDLDCILQMDRPNIRKLFKLMAHKAQYQIDGLGEIETDRELLDYFNHSTHDCVERAENYKGFTREAMQGWARIKATADTHSLKLLLAAMRKQYKTLSLNSPQRQCVKLAKMNLDHACAAERDAGKYEFIIKTYKDVMHLA